MLIFSFFVIALVYATVGFGGGSSYLAVLAMMKVPFEIMPKLGLICNLLVVSGGCYHYYRQGHINQKLITPFVLASLPMAFLGGLFPISQKVFLVLLIGSLFFAGLRLLFITNSSIIVPKQPARTPAMIVGALLGLLSGMVGLGGGIFLSPIMMNLRWGKTKEIAATASVFIFLNSIAGLFGHFIKSGTEGIGEYWMLFLAVVIGGQIGSRIGSNVKTSENVIQKTTALLILFIALRLLWSLI